MVSTHVIIYALSLCKDCIVLLLCYSTVVRYAVYIGPEAPILPNLPGSYRTHRVPV